MVRSGLEMCKHLLAYVRSGLPVGVVLRRRGFLRRDFASLRFGFALVPVLYAMLYFVHTCEACHMRTSLYLARESVGIVCLLCITVVVPFR